MSRFYNNLLFALVLFACFLVYQSGLNGIFRFDDYPNIINNPYIAIKSLDYNSLSLASQSGFAGPLGRPLSMLSFSINYYFNEFNPYYFKLVNLTLHIINGSLVYLLLLSLFKSKQFPQSLRNIETFALVVSASWLLHPINVSGVLYVVQRMNQLSSLFVFLGLLFYVRCRNTDSPKSIISIWASYFTCLILASLSKENGVLLAPLTLLVEVTFFRFQSQQKYTRAGLSILFILSIALPVIFLLLKLINKPELITTAYRLRNFSLEERLMTESRVLWFYVRQILLPNSQLFGFHFDGYEVSKSIFAPVTTLPAILSITTMAIASLVQLIRKQSIWAFGILFFLISHALESSIIGLEIAYEHRNYLPSLGLLLLFFFYLNDFASRYKKHGFITAISIIYLLFFAYLSYTRSLDWSKPNLLKLAELKNYPESARTNLDAAYVLMYTNYTSQDQAKDYYSKAYDYFAKAAELDKTEIIGLVGLVELHGKFSLPVEPSWLAAINYRLKNYPISSSSSTALNTLQKCNLKKTCDINNEQMKELIITARANGRSGETSRFAIGVNWATYLLYNENNPQLASQEFLKISASLKDTAMLIELGKLCLAYKLNECAINMIQKAKVADNYTNYQYTVNELEQKIKAQK